MKFSVDTSELDALAHDLGEVPGKVAKQAQAVVSRGALNVKNDWQERAKRSAGTHGRHYPYSIGYDLHYGLSGTSAEVGPDSSKKQGSMGRGFEFGSINQPPHMDFLAAAQAEAPRFEKALADLLEDIL